MIDTEKDPRIEAVAKLLFTGPLFHNNDEDWADVTYRPLDAERARCLMAAVDVLRGIDEAAGWEYGNAVVKNGFVSAVGFDEWLPSIYPAPEGMTSGPVRRRPAVEAGQWEPIPDDPA